MIQEYVFTNLMEIRVNRLTRPLMIVPQTIESAIVPETIEAKSGKEETEEISSVNDISEHSAGYDSMFVFPSRFGRVYAGQIFKGFISLSNISKTHSLTNISVKVTHLLIIF